MARKKRRRIRKKKPERKKEIDDIIEERIEHFAEEVSTFFERLGNKIEEKGETWKKKNEEWEDHWEHEYWKEKHRYKPLSIICPFISSVIGIIILSLVILGIAFVNARIGSILLSNLYYFLLNNLGLLFLISIFFSYTSYFSKTHRRAYRPFSPIVTAASVVIFLWLIAQAMSIVNISLAIPFLPHVLFFINQNLYSIFWLVLFLGYIVLAIHISVAASKVSYKKGDYMAKKKSKRRAKAQKPEIRRLYRSGRNKIIGGVCGGIGEYLGIDPVIIRLLWLLMTFAWGAGLLLYIIAWVIIPRNPKHKW